MDLYEEHLRLLGETQTLEEAYPNGPPPGVPDFLSFPGFEKGHVQIHEGQPNPLHCILQGTDFILLVQGGTLRMVSRRSTNNLSFVDSIVTAQRTLEESGTFTDSTPVPVTTCESSLIFMDQSTADLMTEERARQLSPDDALVAYREKSMTEMIRERLDAAGLARNAEVRGSNFKLNVHGRVWVEHCGDGCMRDDFSDDVIPAGEGACGAFVAGFSQAYTLVRRLDRNVRDECGMEFFFPNPAVLTAIASLRLMMLQFVRGDLDGGLPCVSTGEECLLKTTQLSIVKRNGALILVPSGIRKELEKVLNTIISQETEWGGEAEMALHAESRLFNTDVGKADTNLYRSADMNTIIKEACRGQTAKALYLSAAWFTQHKESLYAARLVMSASGMYEDDVDDFIDGVLEKGNEVIHNEAGGHLQLHTDRPDSIRKSGRCREVYVKKRSIRSLGTVMVSHSTIRRNDGIKAEFFIKPAGNGCELKSVGCKLKTPSNMVREALSRIVSVGIGDIVFDVQTRRYSMEADWIAHMLLMGKFGSEGFSWILGSILSNGVPVDPRSRGIGYLPQMSIIFEKGGLLLNEALSNSAALLNCCCTKSNVREGELFVDWGLEHDAVLLERHEGNLVRGRGNIQRPRTAYRCRLGSGSMVK